MLKVVLYGLKDGEVIAKELKKLGNFELRVTSDAFESDAPEADVAVFDCETLNLNGAKGIRVFEHGCFDTEKAIYADDFICYPISAHELNARILRLTAPENRNTDVSVIENAGLKIELENAQVTYNGVTVHLTLLEYRLLCLLAQNCGRLVTYGEILHTLWDSPIGNEMLSIRVFVNAIRKKIAAAGATEELIINRMGKGYELKSE